MPSLIPFQHRHLLAYSAIGVAAIGLSYQCIRIWNTYERHEDFILENPSTSRERSANQTKRQALLEQFRKFTDSLHSSRQHAGIYHFTMHMHHPAALCQLALDGVDIASHVETPKIALRAQFDERDLSKFQLKVNRWEHFLNIFSKFKLTTTATEDELFWLDSSNLEAEQGDTKTQNENKGYGYVTLMVINRRLKRLMRQLAMQLEFGTDRMTNPFIVSQELLGFLLNIVDRFRQNDKAITLLALKTLANVVCYASDSAELIMKSEWFLLLLSMLNEPLYDEERILAHKILINCMHTLGAIEERLSPGIYELHRPLGSQTPKLDIIFVHGLRGSAFHTWRQRDKPHEKTTLFWPKDWLAKDVKEPIRIIALDYASKFIKLSKPMESINIRSKRFQSEFRKAGIGQRPIIFICHSMGGLLVKQMLIENKQLRERTVGILFISTPHRGTPVADTLGRNFLNPTDDIQLLRTSSEINRELNERFVEISKQIPYICTVLECQKTPIRQLKGRKSLMMVPIESGAFERGTVYHLNEHHNHVCKPEHRESPIYAIVYNFVNDSLSNLKN